MQDNYQATIKLLSDSPADDDLLGGGHKSIAVALASLIRSTDGGKAVALEGRWGSGKSSVIRILRKELNASEQTETCLVQFDAWSHQGDPLRRVFLDTLITALRTGDSPFINATHESLLREQCGPLRAQDAMEERRGNRFTRRRRNLFFVLLALLPLAAMGVGHDNEDYKLLGFAVFVSIAVGCIADICCHAIGRWYRRSRRSRQGSKRGWLDWLGGKAALEYKEPTDAVLQVGVDGVSLAEPDPGQQRPDQTSTDFREAFRDAASRALDGQPARRLVIVVDNLDRLTADEARQAWSTLQIFTDLLASADSAGHEWRSRVWLVATFDRDAIAGVFDRGRSADTARKDGAQSTEDTAAFLEKTFDLRIAVPPLVVANWRDYFLARVKEALPERVSEEESIRAYHVALHFFNREDQAPTPRQIKDLINDAAGVVCSRPAECEIRFAELLYYCCLRRDLHTNEEIRARLLQDKITIQGAEHVLVPDWRLHVAMALYGTADAAKAAELLLWPKLATALREGDYPSVQQLAGTPGFWDWITRLEDRFAQQFADSSSALKVAWTFEHAGVRSEASTQGWAVVVRFCDGALTRLDNSRFNRQIAAGMSSAIRISKKRATAAAALSQACAAGPPAPKELIDSLTEVPDSIVEWMRCLAEVAAAAKTIASFAEMELQPRISPGSPETAALMLAAVCRDTDNLVPLASQWRLPENAPPDSIVQLLCQRAGWADWRTDALAMLAQCGTKPTVEPLSVALFEVLRQRSEMTALSAKRVLSLAMWWCDTNGHDDKFDARRKSLVTEGYATRYFARAMAAEEFECAAYWLWHMLAAGKPLGQQPAMPGLDKNSESRFRSILRGDDLPSAFVDSLTNTLDRDHEAPVETLLRYGSEAAPLASAVFKQALQQRILPGVLPARVLRRRWPQVIDVLKFSGAPPLKEVLHAMSVPGYWEEFAQGSVADQDIAALAVILPTLSTVPDALRPLVGKLLANTTESVWHSDLMHGQCSRLTIAEAVGSESLDAESSDALAAAVSPLSSVGDLFESVLDGKDEAVDRVQRASAMLTRKQMAVLGVHVSAGIPERPQSSANALVRAYGACLDAAAAELPPDDFVTKVMCKLASSKWEGPRRAVIKLVKKQGKKADKASGHSKAIFHGKVAEWGPTGHEELQEDVTWLFKRLHITSSA